MFSSTLLDIHRLGDRDVALMGELLSDFDEAFDEVETYCGARPREAYLKRLLGSAHFITLAAVKDGAGSFMLAPPLRPLDGRSRHAAVSLGTG